MTKSIPQVTIINGETGEIIVRDANAEELAQMQLDAENYAARQSELLAKESARQALLDKLGITAEEAKLLLS